MPPRPRKATVGRTPLHNLRVINFGWVWAAPVLGYVLADMGAHVIKIESHKRPDIIRVLAPRRHDLPNESLFAHTTLRSSEGVTLNLTSPRGQEVARDLVKTADVVIENFTPKVMGRYGLDYAALKAVRPDLVMISLSAAGHTGPLANITTYGSIISCLAGLDGVQGYIGADTPSRYGTTIPDPLMGIYGAVPVLAALRHRARTGEGQHIDMSQWEACASLFGGPLMDYVFNKRTSSPKGNRDEMMAPHGVYPSSGTDRWVSIAVKTDSEWQRFCEAVGAPELVGDDRFADVYSRQLHHDALDEIIGRWTSQQTHFEVTALLQALGIAAFPCLSDGEAFDDPHFHARGNWLEVDHHLGAEVIFGLPWNLSKTPGGIRSPAPSMGQHNPEVYSGLLGMDPDDVARLEKDQVLY
ncbi:MAG: CoA transferase [Chloroflexi bacterium]|nr:CoA transferase [Chloroflexota bacterium]